MKDFYQQNKQIVQDIVGVKEKMQSDDWYKDYNLIKEISDKSEALSLKLNKKIKELEELKKQRAQDWEEKKAQLMNEQENKQEDERENEQEERPFVSIASRISENEQEDELEESFSSVASHISLMNEQENKQEVMSIFSSDPKKFFAKGARIESGSQSIGAQQKFGGSDVKERKESIKTMMEKYPNFKKIMEEEIEKEGKGAIKFIGALLGDI